MIVQDKDTKSKDIINDIDMIDGREFELYTGYLMTLLGFKDIVVTQSSGDYGVDVIGSKDNRRYGIQCKNYTCNTVGYHAVEEVCGGCKYYNLNYGIVLTNSTFSPNAINGAKNCGVCLIDRKRMVKLAQHIFNQGKSIKAPLYSDLLDQVQRMSNKNAGKVKQISKQSNSNNIKQILKRHKNSKDRDVLLRIFKQIKAQKHDILKAVDKKKQATSNVRQKIHKQVYLALLKTYHSTNNLFPNPNHINYQLGLKQLTKLIKQMIDDYQNHHLDYVLLDYRRCYKSKEDISRIKNRAKEISNNIQVLNMYYTTTKSTRYINRFCTNINDLINNPILIKVYNLYYHSKHNCGDKRDKSMIKDYLLHRYFKPEFEDTYHQIDAKKLKQITRIAKIKARNTGSMVSFLPISQKQRISLGLYTNNKVEA